MTKPLTTKTGRVLTDADIEVLADEAEQGYDVSDLKDKPSRRKLNGQRTTHEDRAPALRGWVHAKRNRMLMRAVDDDLITVDQAHDLFDLWAKMDDE